MPVQCRSCHGQRDNKKRRKFNCLYMLCNEFNYEMKEFLPPHFSESPRLISFLPGKDCLLEDESKEKQSIIGRANEEQRRLNLFTFSHFLKNVSDIYKKKKKTTAGFSFVNWTIRLQIPQITFMEGIKQDILDLSFLEIHFNLAE